MMKKYLSVFLTLVILYTTQISTVATEIITNGHLTTELNEKKIGFLYTSTEDSDFHDDVSILSDEKRYNTMTIEDDFDEETVLVVLTKNRSWEQYEFTPEDFPEVDLKEVINLDPKGREQIEKQQDLLKSIGLTARQLTELSHDTTPWNTLKPFLPNKLLKTYENSSYTSANTYSNETAWGILKNILPDELLNVDKSGLWLVNPEKYRASLSLKLKNPGKEEVLEAIHSLEKRDDIISASPNGSFSLSAVPNDTLLGEQWALGTGTGNINMRQAWDITTGGTSSSTRATVAVLDTGIQADHPDFGTRVSTSLGKDFVVGSGTGHLSDPHGHGTHVAGIIGATGNNNTGIAGSNWHTNLISLRVLDSSGSGDWEKIAEAIHYARTNNIHIINASISGYGDNTNVRNAVNQYNGLMIFAAGNENNNNNTKPCYPASYNRPNIISVGATSANSNSRASYSNFGSTNVHLFAPGSNILSTFPTTRCRYSNVVIIDIDGITRRRCEVEPVYLFGVFIGYAYTTKHHSNGYHYCDGTSMAAPYVAGVAALMYSAGKISNQNLTSTQLANRIKGSVDKYSSLNTYCSTGGRLNANKAVIRSHDIMGDVNRDGVVKAVDARQVLQYVEGSITFTVAQRELADVDFNGVVNQTDANIILSISARTHPPV